MKRISSYNRPIYWILLLLPTGIALWSFGTVGSFSRMLADDYCSFYYADRLGLMRSLWYWRLTWSGRYTAYAMDWFALKTFGSQGFHMIFPVFLVIWLLTIMRAIYLAIPAGNLKIDRMSASVLMGVIALFTMLALTPNMAQSFYWFNGMRSYGLPLLVVTFYTVLYHWRMKIIQSRAGFWKAITLAFALLFAGGGLSETFAVMQVVLIAYLIALKWLMEGYKRTDVEWHVLFSAFFGATTSLLVVITAPGNAIRQTGLPPPPGFVSLTSISLQAYGKFIYSILVAPEKASALLGAILAMAWLGTLYKNPIITPSKQIVFHLIGGVILSFVCIPPSVYAYSETPPSRVFSISLYMLLAGFLIASYLTGSLLASKTASNTKTEVFLVLPAILCLGFSAWMVTSITNQDKRIYQAYAMKWDSMDAQIRQARDAGEGVVHIPKMTNWANLDYPNDNPEFWATECYSLYYGLHVFGTP